GRLGAGSWWRPAIRCRPIRCVPATWGWRSRVSGGRPGETPVESRPMSTRAIIPVKLSLTEGDFYTLWAPNWKEHGAEWQAFLGDDAGLYLFTSPAKLYAFLQSGKRHDLLSHPKWGHFDTLPADMIVPDKKETFDIIGTPAFLAGRPSYENVAAVARSFQMTKSLAEVLGIDDVILFFASHSVLGNVQRGADHYSGEHGLGEWSAVG